MNCTPSLAKPVAAAVLTASICLSAGAQSLGCLITPSNLIELGSPSVGIIQKVYIERGDSVSEGQVLATLRGDVEKANVSLATTRAGAEADLQASVRAHDFALRKLNRTQDLFNKEFVSAQAVDQALAESQAAEAHKAQALEQSMQAKKELAVVMAQLDTRTIRSPVDGVVVDLYRRSGERVEERPILKIATLDPLHVEVVLPATMYRRIRPGVEVMVKPDMQDLSPLKGTVRITDRLIDPASNTFRARIVLPNPGSAIPAGLRCQAQFPDEGSTKVGTPGQAAASSAGFGATKKLN
jgi:RND family efflux transporter MFP subunit